MSQGRNLTIINNKIVCSINHKHKVITGEPRSIETSYCADCGDLDYINAKRCPHCGTKYGYAPGTGNCGCEVDFD